MARSYRETTMLDIQSLRTPPLVVAFLLLAVAGQGADSAPPALRSLTIVPDGASIDEGAAAVFVAIGTYANGARKNVTDKARWSSSNRKLATVTSGGTAAGLRAGKVTIKAVIGKIEAGGELTIQPRLK